MTRWQRAALGGLGGVLLAMASARAGADWQKNLEARLEAQWKLAHLTFMADNLRSTGTPMVLIQAGVHAERNFFATNEVRDGQVRPPGAANQVGAFLAGLQDADAHQYEVVLPRYQPVYLAGFSVSRDRILVRVVTRGQFLLETVDRDAIGRYANGTSRQGDRLTKVDASIRKAALVFYFGSGLEQTPFESIVATLTRVFVPADDPAVPRPGAVALGMKRDEVLRNLGRPLNVISLGAREILVFDKIKVTLENGAVVDVQ
jgi:hypothetical protein